MIPFPDKKYDIIYADPPWRYEHNYIFVGGDAADHYHTMSLSDICAMPVKDIRDTDCLLFLWVVSPSLDEGLQVGMAWGFTYKTIGFVWDKQMPLRGSYTMSQCEMCLIFKRGNIPKPRGARNVRQFLSCKRGVHSEKPWEIRQRITEMFPTQSKIELFAG